MDWYSVDLPNVIALRDELVPADDHAYSVAASLADDSWTEQIPSDRPTMLIADGLLAFLPESVIIGLFRRIPEYFGSGEVAMNDYGRVSRLNIAAMKIGFSAVGNQWAYQGFSDATRSGELESTVAAGRGDQPVPRSGDRPLSGGGPGVDPTDGHDQIRCPCGANLALPFLEPGRRSASVNLASHSNTNVRTPSRSTG